MSKMNGAWVWAQILERRLLVGGCKVHTDKAWIELFDETIAAAREDERSRCARITDDQAEKANEDGDPASVAACRIASRKIRSGDG